MAFVTIEDFIKSKPEIDMNYEFLSYYEKIDDVALISYNILNDYYRELRDISVVTTLSDDDMIKYKYHPDRLCQYVYGSGNLAFIILALNGMASEKEFIKNKVRMLYQKDMNNVVTQILNAERDAKNLNDQEIKK